MFFPLSLGMIRFSALPLVCSAPGAELNSAGGAEKKGGTKKLPPYFFSAPAKINPAHATKYDFKSVQGHFARKNFKLDSWSPGTGFFPIGTTN